MTSIEGWIVKADVAVVRVGFPTLRNFPHRREKSPVRPPAHITSTGFRD
jgi:hypothetical protein